MRYLARTAIALILSASSTLFAQTSAQLAAQPSFALDVVSIKPNNSNSRNSGGGFIASGVLIVNVPLVGIVYEAYFPYFQGNNVIGAPAWTESERYDIVAHVDEASAPAWQKLSPRQWQQFGKPMLQKLLAERCNLVAHLVPSQADGYALVVSKGGARLTPAKPGETYPDGVKNIGGEGAAKVIPATPANGNIMRFFNTSMKDLAEILGVGSVVQNQTNLNGRYDFTIRRLEIPKDPDGKPTISDPQPYDLWDTRATGLNLKPVKVPSQNLIIDHIERPTPN